MQKIKKYLGACMTAGVLALATAAPARAAVSLLFNDGNNDGNGNNTTTSVSGITGGNVSVTLRLSVNTESVSTLDYLLHTDVVPSKGGLTISARNVTTAANTFAAPSFDATNDDTKVGIPGLALNPNSGTLSLGGSTSNGQAVAPGTASVANTYTVATYTLNIAAGTPNGAYTISTVNGEYSGPPNFSTSSVTTNASYVINVVPEPASLGLAGVAGGLMLLRRRRRQA